MPYDIDAIRGAALSIARNTDAERLMALAIDRGECSLSAHGALLAQTGMHTGRSAKDKYILRDGTTEDRVWWEANQSISPAHFATLEADFLAAAAERDLFEQQLLVAPAAAKPLRAGVFTETAWHALFIRNLLAAETKPVTGAPDMTILHLPSFKADPERHGVRSATVIALDLTRNLVLIGGTAYAGEIKKAVFSIFNFHAPQQDILPMHCAANVDANGDTALFFGLSGTGKTTLSTDPDRALIGDDEHGWDADGIFNLEGGCYAKTAGLTPQAEPEIHAATHRFGTVLENVAWDAATLLPDFADTSLTENGRAAYPLAAIAGASKAGKGGAPRHVVFLTADAFGVLPPIARLTHEQALYYFVSGYTAKLSGTERGVTEPQATFSACFGAPFMSQHPFVYGELLVRRLAETAPSIWLINTGWTGGAYGTGRRIPLATTRRLVSTALSGELDRAAERIAPVFGLAVPRHVEGVDDAILDPRAAWSDPVAYDAQAQKVAALFDANMRRFGDLALDRFGGQALAVAAE